MNEISSKTDVPLQRQGDWATCASCCWLVGDNLMSLLLLVDHNKE